jgi:polyisoprenoid-binding protein YceI
VLLDRSEIRFTAKQLGVNVDGRFRRFKANVVFRPNALPSSKADIEVDLGSIDLASDDSENEVKGPLWFDTSKFPVARFSSSSIKDAGGGRYDVAGRLSIKGISRDITIPVVLTRDAAGNRVAEGSFPVKRLEFKVGEGAWGDTDTVADTIVVRIRMVLPPQA